MKIRTTLLFISYFTCLNSQIDLTSPRFDFEPELTYNSEITSPEEFLDYELGASFTLYANAVQYFKLLADQSPLITMNEYGETYEGRKLYNLIITSEENHNRLPEIKRDNDRLADPRTLLPAEAHSIIKNKPVFISYSYNIHGNEASSTEAAMQVAYRLAAVDDQNTRNILKNAVMIFYICINPDGRDRYVYWYEGAKRMVIADNPSDLDHNAPWPNGRTNHYWFDLNRDWIWGVHPESRGHTGEYQKWLPQLHVDYHEQGYNNNYFTVPGTTPRNLLLPDAYESLADTIGMANIRAFDKHKINYFTREAFDFFYPGYGSSYPTVMGAIGMLTEQGGIGAGVAVRNNDGNVLTLRQRIFDHYTTSISTIQKGAEKKDLFNDYFYQALNPKSSKSKTKAYIIRNENVGHIKDFINVMLRNKIEFSQALHPFSASSAYNYRTGFSQNVQFQKGDFIIKNDQPRHLLINTIMTHQMGIEDSVMYDMSTWSAPMAYNLEAYSTSKNVSVKSSPVKASKLEEAHYNGVDNAYAYLIDYSQKNAPKALSMLWQKGYKVRMAKDAFRNGGNNYGNGTLIILVGRNLDKSSAISADMAIISAEARVVINSTSTGRSDRGIDLASRDSRVLHKPKAAMLVGQPFNTYTCGQIYFLFDQESHFGIDRIRVSQLQQSSLPKLGSRYGYADLNDYDVLVLAGGGSSLKYVFDDEASKKLKEWVQNGGTLVATESAANYFSKSANKIWNTDIFSPEQDTSNRAKTLAYNDRNEYYGKKRVPGAALYSHIDISNPLAFGMKSRLFNLKFGNSAIKPSVDLESVGRYEDNAIRLMASGYASKENLKHLSGKTFAAVDHIGRGKIIYLLDNTQYRMFWKGPSRMMQNAVMIMHSM
ncbi:MAG: M14 family metallopeptidase [Saprospiraceae bacterium]